MDAPDATVKLPESVPAVMMHAEDVKRPAGTDVMRQVVPKKSEPEAVTKVPAAPDVGDNSKVGVIRLNQALPASPLLPVTMTSYAPVAPDAAVNEPDIAPPAKAQTGLEIKPLGDDVIVQLVSAALKPEPRTDTAVPGLPEAGVRLTEGVTKNVAVRQVPLWCAVTFTTYEPRGKLPLLDT